MNFINLKIKIQLAKEEILVPNEEVFVSEKDVLQLTSELKEMNIFKEESKVSFKSAGFKSPFKFQDFPNLDSESEEIDAP